MKFHNVWTKYRGVNYHSRLEAAYAKFLDSQKKLGRIKSWRRQVAVNCDVNSFRICQLIVDFAVLHLDRKEELVEIKGMETPVWRLKYKLLKALHPNLWYTVLKKKDLIKLKIIPK